MDPTGGGAVTAPDLLARINVAASRSAQITTGAILVRHGGRVKSGDRFPGKSHGESSVLSRFRDARLLPHRPGRYYIKPIYQLTCRKFGGAPGREKLCTYV